MRQSFTDALVFYSKKTKNDGSQCWQLLKQLDVILSGSSKLLDGYLTSRVLEIDDALPGLKVTFAVYVEFNSTAKPHLIDTVVRQFLNR